MEDPVFMKLIAEVNSKDRVDFEMRSDDALLNYDRWRVPSDVMLRNDYGRSP